MSQHVLEARLVWSGGIGALRCLEGLVYSPTGLRALCAFQTMTLHGFQVQNEALRTERRITAD